MESDPASFFGSLLIFVICAWVTWHGCTELGAQVKSGKAVDQTLSEVDKSDAPNLYGMQLLGFVILIGASACIGIGAAVVFIQKLMGD